MTLRTPICEQFGIEVPTGMGGVAYAKVCAAVSEAGGFGTLGMAGESPDGAKRCSEVRRLTDKPFGVDLLAALPEQMMDAIDTVIEEGGLHRGARGPRSGDPEMPRGRGQGDEHVRQGPPRRRRRARRL